MSLYYENGESTKISKAYSENKQVWLVYEGPKLVWSFKEDYASMKLSNNINTTWYFTNGHSIRFYDMRNRGLTPVIKSYRDVTNHKKHCKNVYAKTYNIIANGSYKETGIYSCTGNFVFDYEDIDENLFPACGVLPNGPTLNIDTNSINYTYYVKNDNSPDGVDRIDTTREYSFFNGLFKNCINMHSSFAEQKRLTGKAVCGALTKDFSSCFENCSNISEAVCGPNVINMAYSYRNCHNLTGSAACGPSVVNMEYAYYFCYNITKAACSDSVVNMRGAYYWCNNLNGYAACGDSVEDMYEAYYGCRNLQYGVCGENVKNFRGAYGKCYNLLDCNIGNNVTDMAGSFEDCRNLISIYCDNALVKDMYSCFSRCYNLKTFYISNSAIDITSCYFFCRNMQGDVYIPESTIYATGAFKACSTISSATIKSSKINNMRGIFDGCTNLKQVTISGSTENIVNMYGTFLECSNLTSLSLSSSSFPNVTSIELCFAKCSNLTSLSLSDSSFPNVTSMTSCFRLCNNLRMQCIIPPKVVDIAGAYHGCENVYGSVTLPDTVKRMNDAFRDTGITSITFPSIDSNQRISMSEFITRSKDVINRYGKVTLYCPAGSGALNSIKKTYNFYKNDNGTIVYTGHNNAYDIDLVLI